MPLEITVYGIPAAQGSKRFMGIKGGKGIMIENSKRVKPWREAVVHAARDFITEQTDNYGPFQLPAGPLRVEMTFTMPKPKSAKKSQAHPDRRPDLSKLVRAAEDALTDAGVWEDDARVVTYRVRKVYPGTHPDALNVPGCVIRISEVKE